MIRLPNSCLLYERSLRNHDIIIVVSKFDDLKWLGGGRNAKTITNTANSKLVTVKPKLVNLSNFRFKFSLDLTNIFVLMGNMMNLEDKPELALLIDRNDNVWVQSETDALRAKLLLCG